MCILGDQFCRRYKNKIINIHPALIPSFCGEGYYGLHVHEAALNYGVRLSGATVHFVNEVTDGGAIILQRQWRLKTTILPSRFKRELWSRPSGKFCRGGFAFLRGQNRNNERRKSKNSLMEVF